MVKLLIFISALLLTIALLRSKLQLNDTINTYLWIISTLTLLLTLWIAKKKF